MSLATLIHKNNNNNTQIYMAPFTENYSNLIQNASQQRKLKK